MHYGALCTLGLLLLSCLEYVDTQCGSQSPARTVDCSHRGLDEIPGTIPNTTVQLDLNGNYIFEVRDLAFPDLIALKELDLSNCSIREIQPNAFAGLASLRTLRLSDNQLTSIRPETFSSLKYLQFLWLFNNPLTKIKPGTFSTLYHLITLSLSGSNIRQLQQDVFSGLPNLKRLSLNDGLLKGIDVGAFSGLQRLHHLHLQNNELKMTRSGVFANLTNLLNLDLRGNELVLVNEADVSVVTKGRLGQTDICSCGVSWRVRQMQRCSLSTCLYEFLVEATEAADQSDGTAVCVILNRLSNTIADDSQDLDETQLETVVELVDTITSANITFHQLLTSWVLDAADYALKSYPEQSSGKNDTTSKRLLASLDRLGRKLQFEENDTRATFEKQELVLSVVKPSPGMQGLHYGVEEFSDNSTNRFLVHLNTMGIRTTWTDQPASSGLPRSVAAIDLTAPVLQQHPGNVYFLVYRTLALFQGQNNTDGAMPVNSVVVSASVGTKVTQETIPLPEPVTIRLRHNVVPEALSRCVFWDFGRGGWSDRGCRNVRQTQNSTTCQCDHLTNLAVLLDAEVRPVRVTETAVAVSLALTYLSYIGCGLSIVGVLAVLITYLVFRKFRRQPAAKILLHLCVAILGLCIGFIVIVNIKGTIICKVFAAVTHFFLLSTFTWMVIGAYHLFRSIVIIDIGLDQGKFVLKSSVIGWGLPVLFVIATGASRSDNYGAQSPDICWLSRIALYAGCLAPAALTLIINFAIFIGVIVRQCTQKKLFSEGMTSPSGRRMGLKGYMTLTVLLGLTWVFAFFSFGGASDVFDFLFVIFNSLQGLFLSFSQCIVRKDVRDAWKGLCCKPARKPSIKTPKGDTEFDAGGTGRNQSTDELSDIDEVAEDRSSQQSVSNDEDFQ